VKPSNRIVNWLRDFDPHMRIRWSASYGEFSVERKARISDKLRAEVERRCNMAFNPHETGSAEHVRLEKLRRLARLRLEAVREGYETVCTIPASTPTDEAELIEWLRANDPWRFGRPDEKGADGKQMVATMLADDAAEKQLAAPKAAEKSARLEIAARSKDAANDVFLRLGSTVTFSDRKKKKRKRKAA
jgi:hypothetical protein